MARTMLILVAAGMAGVGILGPVALGQVGADTRPVYPPDGAVPRNLTPAEAAYLRDHPIVPVTRAGNQPPTGPVRCPGEYEPCDGIIVAWQGLTAWTNIHRQMGAHITTTGDADLYVVVDNPTEQATVQSQLTVAGANMARVRFITRTIDTIWLRDYGPRYIYEGNTRAIVDHVYNRPRPNDDTFPVAFATYKHHARYALPLVHGGGNFHLDGLGNSFVTRLVDNENPTLTEQQIHDLWQAYQNVDTTFFTPFPTSVDSTQHIDMWVQVIGDHAVMVSDWPMNAGSAQDQVCDSAAATFASRGYTVYRLPARSVNSVHYTYTNVVMCNNLVLVPSYTNAQVQPHNAEALSVWQQACPGKTIVQINCEALVSYAGVMHCIVMHMPAPVGGVNPTAYLRAPRGGQTLTPGSPVNILWNSDDDRGVANVDLLLSIDGGATYERAIALAAPDTGTFTWTTPNFFADHARVRIVVRDADGNTGSDQSPADFVIDGCRADFDADGAVNVQDFLAFLGAYSAGEPRADTNGDGAVNIQDFLGFLTQFSAGCV
jgi:agmatine deiminase